MPLEEMEVAQSLLVQQKALTSLVAHIAQDGLHDLGASSSSSTGLSFKGLRKERS